MMVKSAIQKPILTFGCEYWTLQQKKIKNKDELPSQKNKQGQKQKY